LLAARILSVADVFETIASHRPYRPSLGLQRAMDEVRENRGKLYDGRVVDICLALFEEARFQFPK
jgi:putative two-component system response regulator